MAAGRGDSAAAGSAVFLAGRRGYFQVAQNL
jgi:hypothetical protein